MSLDNLLMRLFGHPQGLLGRLGGYIMAHTKGTFTPWVLGLLEVQAEDRVLEVGFGPGVAIQQLAASTPVGSIAGIDSSREMLEQAEARNAKTIAAGRIDLRLSSVEHLPFDDNSFDKVMSINSLQVWPDAVAALREILRVMKAGGKMALGFTAQSHQPVAGLTEQVTAAGFYETRVVEIDQGFCLLATKLLVIEGS
ncbi:MAG: class I SAM-dependent methyltransferase [Methylobacter sp.]|nr:class I SAM-dependent methyltransferase [Methylobacter sp.]